jgi:hypothetical protein
MKEGPGVKLVRLSPLKVENYSHYYNNIFAFHMHMFIISILSFNKLNTTIQSNIRFMVIAYNQNLHFGIHWKKLHKQDYNSFHRNLTLQKIHTKYEYKIHYRSLCFFILLKTWIQIIASSHVLLKKPKQHLKSVLYQNKVYGFLLQVPPTPPTLF